MNANKIKWILGGAVLVAFFLFAAPLIFAGEYAALAGIHDVKVVFDVRVGKVKSAALQIDLIHKTFKDENIRQVSPKPDVVVVFAGGATRLVSTSIDRFTPEEKILLTKIADTVKAMAKDGIRLEVCLFAANVFGVKPETILPEITQVPNGWISLIGYQEKGYRLVGVY